MPGDFRDDIGLSTVGVRILHGQSPVATCLFLLLALLLDFTKPGPEFLPPSQKSGAKDQRLPSPSWENDWARPEAVELANEVSICSIIRAAEKIHYPVPAVNDLVRKPK